MVTEAFALGLTYMLAPGPVLLETVRRGLHGGVRSAAAVQCGAMVAELLYVVLFVGGVGQALVFPSLKFGLGMLGAALLVYLGVSMARDRKRISHEFGAVNLHRGTFDAAQKQVWQSFSVGVLLLLLSPYSFAFWFSVGSATLNQSIGSLSAFIFGSALGCTLVVLAAKQFRAPRMRWCATWVWSGCAIVLVVLGVQIGYTTLLGAGA